MTALLVLMGLSLLAGMFLFLAVAAVILAFKGHFKLFSLGSGADAHLDRAILVIEKEAEKDSRRELASELKTLLKNRRSPKPDASVPKS